MNQSKSEEITIDWSNGDSSVHSGAEIYEVIFNSNKPWMLSANGTIFTYEYEGIIPGLIEKVGMLNVKKCRENLAMQKLLVTKLKLSTGTNDN
jgi:hypothetical protein